MLRDRRFDSLKFRRQHPCGPYFLDFFCEELKLAIELDGGQHGEEDQQQHDSRRDAYLRSQGITVMRVWNSRLRENAEGVRFRIREVIAGLREEK